MATTIIPKIENTPLPILTFSKKDNGGLTSDDCNLDISFSFIPTTANADILVTLSLAPPVFFCFTNNLSVLSFNLKDVDKNDSVTKTVKIKLKSTFTGSPILTLFVNAKDIHSENEGQSTTTVCGYRII